MAPSQKTAPAAPTPALPLATNLVTEKKPRAYREALLGRLVQDIPDLGAAIAKELDQPQPSSNARAWVVKRQQLNRDQNTASLRAESLQQAIPFDLSVVAKRFSSSTIGAPNDRKEATSNAPWMLTLSETDFSKEKANPSTAAWLLMDFLHIATEHKSKQHLWPSHAVNQRLKALLADVKPDHLAGYLPDKHPNLEKLNGTGVSPPLKKTVEALFEASSRLTSEQIGEKASKPEEESPSGFVAMLPPDSTTLAFLDARQELLKLLKRLETKPNGEWLNQKPVWKAVRELAAQSEFSAQICLLLNLPQQPKEAVEDQELASNPLLAELAELEFIAPKTPDHASQAQMALEGYLAGIQDPADLAAFTEGLFHGLKKSPRKDILQQINEVAVRINFSLKDAAFLIEDLNQTKQIENHQIPELLGNLFNPAWSSQSLDSLLTHKILPLHSSCLVPLAVLLFQKNPALLDDLSENSVVLLSKIWAEREHHIKERLGDTFIDALTKRVETLSSASKTSVFISNMKNRWKVPEITKANFKVSTAAVKGLTAAQIQEAFLESSQVVWKSDAIGELLQLIPAENRTEEGLANIVCQLKKKGSEEFIPNLPTLATIAGYDPQTPSVNAGTIWNHLDDSAKREWMGRLCSCLIEREQLSNNLPKRLTSVPSSVVKNMVFDLNDRLGGQPDVELKSGDSLVLMGLAKAGEKMEWQTVLDFIAPFLKQPRPPASWGKQGSLEIPQKEALDSVLTLDILESRMVQQKNEQGNHPFFGPMRMDPRMKQHMHMDPRMKEHMLQDMMCLGPKALRLPSPITLLPLESKRVLIAFFVAEDVGNGKLSSGPKTATKPSLF